MMDFFFFFGFVRLLLKGRLSENLGRRENFLMQDTFNKVNEMIAGE